MHKDKSPKHLISDGDLATESASTAERITLAFSKLIREMVDRPEAVKISFVRGEQTTVFEIMVSQEDVKRVIGRKGRTAAALRELILNLGAKNKQKFVLEILEPSTL